MSTFTPTKQCLWSSVWRFLVIQTEVLIWYKNAFSIGLAFFPSHYTIFSYSSTIVLLCYITWKYWGKCKEEPLYGSWEPSKPFCYSVSKLLQDLYPSNSIFRSLVKDCNYKHTCFPLTTSYNHSWIHPIVHPYLNILPYLTFSLDASVSSSKAT